MLTPSEIFRTFAPFIGTIKQGNIIYQDKKIYIQDTGTLIFDMDLGATENIYFPTAIFNTILKTKSPTFKKKDDQLYVESTLSNGKKKNINFTYYKLDNNPIELPDESKYDILYTFDTDQIVSMNEYTKFIQKESETTYSGFFLSGTKKFFVSGSKTFSYISQVNDTYPVLNLVRNFVFQSMEEGIVHLCRNKENSKYFYLIVGEGYTCTLPVQQEKIYPKSILDKYETFCNIDNFHIVQFTGKDIKEAFKEITTDIGKNELTYLEFEIHTDKLFVTMQNKEKVSSKVELQCTSPEKMFLRINSPEEKEILSAFLKYEGIISFMIPKHGSMGKICVIDGDVKFVCTYNELRI